MNPRLLAAVQSAIESAAAGPVENLTAQPCAAGCINRAFVLHGPRSYFVKVNSADRLPMFEAEAESVRALAATGAIRVPAAIASGAADDSSFLVLEYLPMRSGSPAEHAELGRQLAALHRAGPPDGRFGWSADNFIGSTPQENGWHADWSGFWRERRLEPQLRLAGRNGARFHGAEELLDGLDEILAGHAPAPSLLHGDLWAGNASFLGDGTPVIYDPAAYLGDRETDLAFTEFFGGYPPSFYEAYDAAWPRPQGWQARSQLYNLYHVLNHFNLFGGAYGRQAQEMIRDLNRNPRA